MQFLDCSGSIEPRQLLPPAIIRSVLVRSYPTEPGATTSNLTTELEVKLIHDGYFAGTGKREDQIQKFQHIIYALLR